MPKSDITKNVSDYLLGDKNVNRCVQAVSSMHPGDSDQEYYYISAIKSLLVKYLGSHGPVLGGSMEGKAFIKKANDACVTRLCRILTQRHQNAIRPSSEVQRVSNRDPGSTPQISVVGDALVRPRNEIDILMGYSMLDLYPLDSQTARNSQVTSERTMRTGLPPKRGR
tara:strand:+ start:128 stop:631 length:504 start_codon:yes stop_codon:yes gene_type:complete